MKANIEIQNMNEIKKRINIKLLTIPALHPGPSEDLSELSLLWSSHLLHSLPAGINKNRQLTDYRQCVHEARKTCCIPETL